MIAFKRSNTPIRGRSQLMVLGYQVDRDRLINTKTGGYNGTLQKAR
jgi:hypothetical protein